MWRSYLGTPNIAIQQLVMGALTDTEMNKSNGRLCEQVSTLKSSRYLHLLLRILVLFSPCLLAGLRLRLIKFPFFGTILGIKLPNVD